MKKIMLFALFLLALPGCSLFGSNGGGGSGSGGGENETTMIEIESGNQPGHFA